MKIGIIGAGLTGSSILKYILNHPNFNKEDKIYIFEKRNKLGPGDPYEKDTPIKMLNVAPQYMSIDRDNEYSFCQWLEENIEEPFNFEKMVSREDYGLYLEDYFREIFDHESVEVIHDEVTDLEIIDGTYRLKTNDWLEIDFSTIFLAFGNPVYADYYDLKGHENYIHDPYPMSEKLGGLESSKRIGIIGAGASSVDVFRYLSLEVKPRNGFDFFIRETITNFPSLTLEDNSKVNFNISFEWIEDKKNQHNGLIPLENLLELVDKDLKEAGVDIIESYKKYKDLASYKGYEKIIEEGPEDLKILIYYLGLTSAFHGAIYGSMSKSDQEKYMKDYHPIFDMFYTLVPEVTTKWIIESLKDGKIRFNKGLYEIEHKDGKFLVKGNENIEVDYIINTTGFDLNLENNAKENLLLRNLYDKKIISAFDGEETINVNWPNSTIISNRYGNLDTLISIGMFQKGIHYMPNGAITLREVTYKAVEIYMEEVYPGL